MIGAAPGARGGIKSFGSLPPNGSSDSISSASGSGSTGAGAEPEPIITGSGSASSVVASGITFPAASTRAVSHRVPDGSP
jgi:hypothetical protein